MLTQEEKKKALKRYNSSEKGVERKKRYEATEKGKKAKKKYLDSDKGKKALMIGAKKYSLTEKGKESTRRGVDKYKKNNSERYLEGKRASSKKKSSELSASYIKQLIKTNFKRGNKEVSIKDIPQELIELKRKQIKLKRLCQSIKN